MVDEKLDITITNAYFKTTDIEYVFNGIKTPMRSTVMTLHCINNDTGLVFKVGPMKVEFSDVVKVD